MLRMLLLLLLCCNHVFAQETKKPSQAWTSSVHWSPDNKLLYTSSYDSSIRIWSVQSGKLLNTLRTRELILRSLLSNDGKYLAAKLSEGGLEIWDMEQKKCITTRRVYESFQDIDFCFSADSKTLITTTSEQGKTGLTIYLWNCATGEPYNNKPLYTTQLHTFSRNGERLATLSKDGHLIVWDINTLKPLQDKMFAHDSIRQIGISTDTKMFATLGSAGLTLFDINSADSIRTITMKESIRSFSFDPANKYILTIAYSGNIDCWEIATGKHLRQLANTGPQEYGWLARITYDKKGKRAAIAYDAKSLKVIALTSGKILMDDTSDQHLLMPTFNRKGNKLLLSEGYHGTSIWNINTGKRRKTY